MPKRLNLDTLSGRGNNLPKISEQELTHIYQRPIDDDFNTLRRRATRQRRWLFLVIIVLLLLLGGGVWYIFFSGQGGKFGEEALSLKLVGPTTAPSGQVSEYILNWHNDQGVDLTEAELEFRYPQGVTVEEVSRPAANEAKNRFNLGIISANSIGELVLKLRVVGEVGENKEISVLFTYQPANFRAQFARTALFTTQLVASVINVEIYAPPQLPRDQNLTLKISYNNTSVDKLSSLALKLIIPTGFELTLPNLENVIGQTNLWKLSDLEAKTKAEMELSGKFTNAALSGNQEFAIAIGILDIDNNLTVQEEKKVIVSLIENHLTLNLSVNQVTLTSYADWGEQLDFNLRFANEGDIALTKVALSVKLDKMLLDWNTWQADNTGQLDQNQGIVTWNSDTMPELVNLEPGAKGNIAFRLKVISFEPQDSQSPYSFESKVEAQATQLVGSSQQAMTTTSNVVVTKINTQLLLQSDGRYYTDQLIKVGSGPLPPKVGATTTYVIYWRLANTLNDATDIEVTTTLPQEVTWTGQANISAGQPITYNYNTRQVRWQLNRLPAGAGFKFTKPEASFEVAVTPQLEDADKILVLAKSSTVTAKDSFSGADLIATAKMVTTELDDDLGAQGKGVVVR